MISTNHFNIYNASAGTGKTFSMVRDYLILLFKSQNLDLYKNILAITFTNKAVNETKGRIVKYLISYSNLHTLKVSSKSSLIAFYLQEKIHDFKLCFKTKHVLFTMLHVWFFCYASNTVLLLCF